MKISYEQRPMCMEFKLISSQEKFYESIRKLNYVYVNPRMITKTRVSTSLYIPGYSFSINKQVEGIKTDLKKEYSFLDYNPVSCHYFKVLKNQRIEKYEEYITTLIKTHIADLPEDFEVKIYETDAIRKLKSVA